jgi:glycosyltransferase involved in cell wall biosynthesis
MRIAYLITRADAVGGASVHVREMAAAMRARGHDVRVFVGGAGPVTEELARAGVPFHSLAALSRAVHPLRDLRALAELTSALREFAPDLVSTHTAKAGWIGRAACARLRLPAIYTPHGWPFGARQTGLPAMLFRLAEKAAARWARAIVCVCDYERRLALDRGVAAPDRLVVVHNGVRDVPQDLRAVPGADPPRIVSLARFEPPKDHATLLEALARLRERQWSLDLVGDGPLEPACRALAQRLGLSGRVRFLGYQPDAATHLARAQLFVLSSRSEAFPRSVLEAMRAGLPVVASAVGGVAEVVDNGSNGVLVPRDDSVALSAAIGGLLEDPVRRERLGKAARLTYESRFRLERMVEGTVAVYDSVLKSDASRRTAG